MSNLFSFASARQLTAEELQLTTPEDTGHYDADAQTWTGGSEAAAGPCSFSNFYPYTTITRGDYWTTC
ncbi:hypothetical protein [Allokutzneria oryzae]|uniref:Uncharacterized protein n=1 Tax=Allokutzneria oryzae TaxID=1378989 RepID=A0ABV5ZS46_9PSEU